ncbi:putative C6 transcription factor [Xylariaceae sp. FL1019]|nr:putative C6 transcription factor [Xylariaceae sp. FL1019]
MTDAHFVPILPKPDSPLRGDDEPPPGGERRPGLSRSSHVACDPCRRSKIKCDGGRPLCYKCRSKGKECVYDLPAGDLSRASFTKKVITELRTEVNDLRDLFRHLSHGSNLEAGEVLRRLKGVEDPVGLARSIRQAELLLPNPAALHGQPAQEDVELLESSALEKSLVKVPARPWTVVAGDGIVSDLISSWFRWEHPFPYPFIDREAFIKEMRKGDPKTAKHCSPFLVNVICAMRSMFSHTVRAVTRTTRRDMVETFWHEAMELYNHATPSLPTIQGLWILFGISMLKGQDRRGSVYRLASYAMMKRMKPEDWFTDASGADAELEAKRRAISQTYWGIFCLESLSTLTLPIHDGLPVPEIPVLFTQELGNANVDFLGEQFGDLSPQPPIVAGMATKLCTLAEILNRVIQHNDSKTREGSEADRVERKKLYLEVQEFGNSLPPVLRVDHNFTPQTCFLRNFMDITIYAVIRPLSPTLQIDAEIGPSVKHILLAHCALDANLMERYFSTWSTLETSSMVITTLLHTGMALLRLFPDEKAGDIFARICRLLHLFSAIPVAHFILRGWQAALLSMKVEIPPAAIPFFQDLEFATDGLRGVSSNLQVASFDQIEDGEASGGSGRLGELLDTWADPL